MINNEHEEEDSRQIPGEEEEEEVEEEEVEEEEVEEEEVEEEVEEEEKEFERPITKKGKRLLDAKLEPLAAKFERPITDKEKRSLADELDIRREDTRSELAKLLMRVLAGTYISAVIIMIVIIFVPEKEVKDRNQIYAYSKDIISLLITTQTGLVGAVLGFYFGSSRNKGT